MPHNNNKFFLRLGYISAIKRLETAVEKKKEKKKKFYSILLLSKKGRKWVESLRVEVLNFKKQ
jgi:hypothetical protein